MILEKAAFVLGYAKKVPAQTKYSDAQNPSSAYPSGKSSSPGPQMPFTTNLIQQVGVNSTAAGTGQALSHVLFVVFQAQQQNPLLPKNPFQTGRLLYQSGEYPKIFFNTLWPTVVSAALRRGLRFAAVEVYDKNRNTKQESPFSGVMKNAIAGGFLGALAALPTLGTEVKAACAAIEKKAPPVSQSFKNPRLVAAMIPFDLLANGGIFGLKKALAVNLIPGVNNLSPLTKSFLMGGIIFPAVVTAVIPLRTYRTLVLNGKYPSYLQAVNKTPLKIAYKPATATFGLYSLIGVFMIPLMHIGQNMLDTFNQN